VLVKVLRFIFGSTRFLMSVAVMCLAMCDINPATYATMCATVGAWMLLETNRKS
jgi:hypothetical protein